MSDIKAQLQATSTSEHQELSELAVRKDLHKVETEAANNPDLATACISPRDVMRVPQSVDTGSRVVRSGHSRHTTVELTDRRSRASSRSAERSTGMTATRKADAKSSERAPDGIFKNPRYSYDGGLLNKIFSLLGNIIHVLVQFLLRLLGARDTFTPAQQPQQSKNKDELQGSDPKEVQEREKLARKKRREQAEQLVRRE